ncbi:hypothetical protein NP233_g12651 [Leucocoprinus birnbaumii]|uniref:Uncharacterized protein n=1 Tax=Leucocoprinus birnbaumii TaxID=56174 RepID=A0AAD5VE90_9AGAR|nr:hypothetical protein NP233_g12651 [Leucocoprinus birnbaumii]
MTETSADKSYYILNIGTSQNIGRAPVEDRTLSPKPILTLPHNATVNSKWQYGPLTSNLYQLSISGSPAGVADSGRSGSEKFLFGILQDGGGGEVKPWVLEKWNNGTIGPAYIIRDSENPAKVWTASDEAIGSIGPDYKRIALEDYQSGNLKQIFAFMSNPVGSQ